MLCEIIDIAEKPAQLMFYRFVCAITYTVLMS